VKPYRVAVDLEAVQFLERTEERDRALVYRRILALAQNPFLTGDYTDRDATGRTIHDVIAGGCCLSYWVDHAVREVRVIEVSPAD
jgi:hypothetical protein